MEAIYAVTSAEGGQVGEEMESEVQRKLDDAGPSLYSHLGMPSSIRPLSSRNHRTPRTNKSFLLLHLYYLCPCLYFFLAFYLDFYSCFFLSLFTFLRVFAAWKLLRTFLSAYECVVRASLGAVGSADVKD